MASHELTPVEKEVLTQICAIIPPEIVIEQSLILTFKQQKFTEIKQLNALSRLNIQQYSIYQQVEQYIRRTIEGKSVDLQLEFNNFLKSLRFEYQVEDKLHELNDLDCLNGNIITPGKWQSEVDQVSIILFWTSWSGCAVKRIKQLVELFEETKEWHGSVKLVAISMDDEREHWNKRIFEDNLQDRMQHYRFMQGWDEEGQLQQSLNLVEIPYIYVVDKNSRIFYKGHPKNTQLFTIINNILEGGYIIQEKHFASYLLNEELYEQLKQTLISTLTKEMKDSYWSTGDFKFELIKKYRIIFDNGGLQVTLRERTPIFIQYKMDKEQVYNLQVVTKILRQTIPMDCIIYRNCVMTNFHDNFKQSLKNWLEDNKVYIIYKENKQTKYTFKNDTNPVQIQFKVRFQVEVYDDYYQQKFERNINKFIRITSLISKFYSQNNNSSEVRMYANMITKKLQFGIGDKFIGMENYHDLNSKPYHIQHSLNSILIIVYWNESSKVSIESLENCIQVINRFRRIVENQLIQMIALSTTTKGTDTFKLVSSQVRENYEFYFPQDKETEYQQLYGVKYLSHQLIVNQSGVIIKNGSEVNIEQTLMDLFYTKISKFTPIVNNVNNNKISKQQQDKLKQYLESKYIKEILNGLGNSKDFILQIKLTEVTTTENNNKIFKYPKFDYSIREVKLPILQQFFSLLYNIVPEQQTIIKSELTTSFDVPFPGKNCQCCNKALNKDMGQYYNPFTNAFLCIDCAEYDDQTKVGLDRYKCSDTLIFINAPLDDKSVLRDIDVRKKGNNIKIAANEEGSQIHKMICFGCSGDTVGPRYIAIGCVPGRNKKEGYVDFCFECFGKLKNKDSESANEIIRKNGEEKLNSDCLFLRILFSNGYYIF